MFYILVSCVLTLSQMFPKSGMTGILIAYQWSYPLTGKQGNSSSDEWRPHLLI